MLCHACKDSQTTTNMKQVKTLKIKTLLQLKTLPPMNSNSLAIKQKQKQTQKQPNKIYIRRLSFKTRLKD